ncbi:hypothetical protein B0H14DRAFT_2767724 [Mycena olivaceomarginata]|nr:hypothetical protein B0H14DRAFT_2767724 [Mycena olivaceomarginata]
MASSLSSAMKRILAVILLSVTVGLISARNISDTTRAAVCIEFQIMYTVTLSHTSRDDPRKPVEIPLMPFPSTEFMQPA